MGAKLLVLAAVVVFVCVGSAAGEWSHDPTENNPVGLSPGVSTYSHVSVSDDSGGVYVAWIDYVADSDLYAQHIDSDGNRLWGDNGLVVCDSVGFVSSPAVCTSATGDLVIAWSDGRASANGNSDIYAQRYDPDGAMQWTEGGVIVCDEAEGQLSPSVVQAGTDGSIVSWIDQRGSVNERIYVQRLSRYGWDMWTPGGERVGLAGPSGRDLQSVSDGEDGVYLTWAEDDYSLAVLRAQHVDSDGDELWGSDGYRVTPAGHRGQRHARLLKDNDNGIYIARYSYDLGTGYYVAVDRVVGDTTRLWTTALECDAGSHSSPEVVSDGVGGIIVVTRQATLATDIDIYAQRLNPAGTKLWGNYGVALFTANGEAGAFSDAVVSDGAGGAIACWCDNRYFYNDVYARRVDASGTAKWEANGALVSGAADDQDDVICVADGSGGVIAVWEDSRGGEDEIYAQRVERNGFLGDPAPAITDAIDQPDDQGGEIILGWTASYLDVWPKEVVNRYSVWRRFGEGTRAGDASTPSQEELRAEGHDALRRYGWTFVDNVLARYLDEYGYVVPSFGDSSASGVIWTDLMVMAESAHLDDYWSSGIVSAYSVDNVAPGAPAALTALELQLDVGLEWSPSGEFDEDLSHYNIYRSDVSGFEIGESSLVDATTDTFYTDIGPGRAIWYYRVAAEDVHGNVGLPSNEAWAETWTGAEDPAPTVYELRGARPNPFNPLTTISYDVPEPGGRVRLEIYDVGGRLVRTLVSGHEEPGSRHTVWNGGDDSGSAASSGVYFCRMAAEGYEKSLKLTLLR